MILQFEGDNGEVYFLEATMAGVSMTPWSQFQTYWNKFYSQVVIRHLYVERTPEMM
jgi:hypothetical protein